MARIYGFGEGNISSINTGDPSINLYPKRKIYDIYFDHKGDCNNMPHITIVNRSGNINSDTVRFLEEFKPDIYVVSRFSDDVLEFTAYKPEVVIYYDNDVVIFNGEIIPPKLSDLDESQINTINKKGTEYLEKYIKEPIYFRGVTKRIVKRLIIEYLSQYKSKTTPITNKSDLRQLVSNLQNQLDELKRHIV